jgi:predicted membrane-bound spermidine synthase
MNQRRVTALYALFALSGFCGLIYESIWSHYLKLFVGHAAYAQTLVLAVFMGGMGLGAWLTARFTARLRNLLWAYAAVEAVIGLAALGFHAVFNGAVDWGYASLLPATCGGEGLCWSQWLLAALLILPQSVLLGTTFPLMSGGVLRLAPETPGGKLALLYFLNSIGAVAGVLASGFVLIPAVGLPGTLLTAGLGNIVIAALVYFIGKAAAEGEGAEVSPPAATGPAEARWLRTLLAVALLTGLTSFIYEVAWIRMLAMVFGSATHSFEIMLAAFILGLALGGLWIRSRIDGLRDALTALAVVQVAMGALALATLPLYSLTFDAMGWLMSGLARNDAGYVLFTVALKVIALAVMLPATFCAGMTLPLITVMLYRGGSGERAIGQVYAANTVGAIAGVLLAVHLLLPLAGLKWSMAIGAVADIAIGAWLLRAKFRDGVAASLGVRGFALVALVCAVMLPLVVQFDPLRMSSGVYRDGRARFDAKTDVLFAQDGKTATVHLVRTSGGVVTLATNGKSDGAIQMKPGEASTGDEVTMSLLGALPLAYKPQAAEVAVIGFGTGMSSATLLGSPHLQRLETIEIEPAMVEAARQFAPVNARAFDDPRHRIVIDDAKAFFARGARRYDVIVSEPSNPWVSGVSSLFTEEFYARARAHLKPGGLFVQWMHVYEIAPELVASVFAALTRSFPFYEIYVGSTGDLIIVASPEAALPARTDAVFGMPGVKAMLDRAGLRTPDHLAVQYMTSQQVLAPLVASYGMPPNSDFFPAVDLQGPKARFLRASATPWTLLHTAEVPALRALDGMPRSGWQGEPPTPQDQLGRQVAYLHASQLAAFVRHGTPPPAGRNHVGDIERAVLLRQRLFACQGANLGELPWDSVVRFAAETIPYLAVAEATGLWSAVRDSPCARGYSAAQLAWLDLLRDVAAGRWREAGPAAAALIDSAEGKTQLQRSVLTKVMAIAHLLAGQGPQAAKAVEAALPGLPGTEAEQLWVRLLLAHARR